MKLLALPLAAAAAVAQAPSGPAPADGSSAAWTLEAAVTWDAPAPDGPCTVQVWHYASPTFGGPELLTSLTREVGTSIRVPIESLGARSAFERAGFVRLEVWAPSRHGGGSANLPTDADPTQPLALTCEVTVHPTTTIAGRALDGDGNPVRHALVRPEVLPLHDDVVVCPTATDSNGRFIAAGSWITDRTRLTIEHPQHGHASRDLDTPKSSHTELGDLTLAITHPRFLTLLFPDRSPVERARIQLGFMAIETDAAGRAPLHHLAETAIRFQLGGHADSAYHPLPDGDAPFVVDAVRARLVLEGPHAVGLDPDQLSVHVIPAEHTDAVKLAKTRSELGDLAVYHQPNRGRIFAAPGAWLWVEHYPSETDATSALVQLATTPNEQVVQVRLAPINQ